MTLSSRDKRIFTAIEQSLADEDPAWARRFARRHRRFDRRERAAQHTSRRKWYLGTLALVWFVVLCVGLGHAVWPLVWGELALAVAVGAITARLLVHRHPRT